MDTKLVTEAFNLTNSNFLASFDNNRATMDESDAFITALFDSGVLRNNFNSEQLESFISFALAAPDAVFVRLWKLVAMSNVHNTIKIHPRIAHRLVSILKEK